jgi:NAD(P)H-dependent flavin oxidoreductase YrpB (nitropropane dioxygenase family)
MIPAEHRAFLDDLMVRYGIGADTAGQETMLGNLRIGDEHVGPLIDVAFAHNPKVFASALGSPPAWLIERAHAKGMLVGALAGAPRHAVKHKQAGCDFVIAQGTEAGGHTGEIATMVLTPQVVDAVAPLPVLSAGGIGSGRQMAAALALGAAGVWCGSIWLTTEEASELPIVKEKLLKATSLDTAKVRCLTGKPVRQLKSAWTEEWERPDTPDPLEMPLQSMLVAPYQTRIMHAAARKDAPEGARDLVNSPAGQIVGMMNESKPAGQVVMDMVEEFIAANERVNAAMAD